MEGVVDPVLRDLLTSIGGLSQCTTEFIRVVDKINPPHVFYKFCPELNTGGRTRSGVPVFVQLLGSCPEALADNASLAVELGAPGIDLNFGCPAKTVNRHDGGATLLKNPDRLYSIISAVKRALAPKSSQSDRVPVTAKVRLGFDSKELCLDIARAVDSAGADRLTIHARTKTEGYRPPAHWEYIAQMAEVVTGCPVVANGDIWSVQDYFEVRKVTGLEDVALGRGLVARPDLALQIRKALADEDHTPLSWKDLEGEILPRFVSESIRLRNADFALARLKQWTRLLGRTYPEAQLYFEKIKTISHSSDHPLPSKLFDAPFKRRRSESSFISRSFDPRSVR